MKKYYYDLHIHSCLSPCGDEENTPYNIAGMAKLSELDIIALTDHNSCKNCPAFFEAAKKYGITPIAGMELTTSEDIHVVCLFEHLSDAMRFDNFVEKNHIKIHNRPDIFGRQTVMDESDNFLYDVDELLINATSISIENVVDTVKEFNGICYPAHIDKDSNSIIGVLGTLPENNLFSFFELHNADKIEEFSLKYGIAADRFIIDSDSHYLTDIRDKNFFFELEESDDHEMIRKKLFDYLKR